MIECFFEVILEVGIWFDGIVVDGELLVWCYGEVELVLFVLL